GGVRKWATFIGGDGTSDGTNLIGLGIDSKNNIFISGSSRTTNTFPTQYLAGSYNQSSQTSDYAVVLSQFNINGVMLWSSYFGNKTWTSSGGFGLYSDICETKMVQCGMAYPDYPIPTIDPGGGAYFHSTSEGLTGQTDFISEFNIYSSSPTPPTSASASPNFVCPGVSTNITLTASGGNPGDGGLTEWFTGDCGTNLIGTGNPLVIPQTLNSNTTYYVRYSGTCGITECVSTIVSVKTDVGISSVSAGASSICPSETTQITANGIVGTGANLTWFTGPGGTGTNLGSNNPLTVAAGTYYARITGDCGSPAEKSITIIENPIATAPTNAFSDQNNICSNSPTDINLSVTGGSGGTLAWFTGSCGGTEIGTGNPIAILSSTTTTTYYARWENSCGVSDCVELTVNIIDAPTAPDEAIVDRSGFCANDPGNIELSVNGGYGNNVHWFVGSCGGTSVGIGNPLIIPSPETTTTYYARWENSCGVSTCINVLVEVNDLPSSPSQALVDRNNVCVNDEDNIELSVTGGNGNEVHWFTTDCGNTEIGTGNPLVIPSPIETTIYFARWENDCGFSSCKSVQLNVIQLPIAPTSAIASVNNVCSDSNIEIELSAIGGSGENLRWFTESCGGNDIGINNPLSINSPTETTEYFVRWENSCGLTDCKSVIISTIEVPGNPNYAEVSNENICVGELENITLTLVGDYTHEVKWYSGTCGGNLVGAGNPLTITAPNISTVYFARYESSCGNSECVSIAVNVNNLPNPPSQAFVDRNNICDNDEGNIELSVTDGQGENLFWYTNACGDTFIGTGNPLIINSPTESTTYFARWENICGQSVCQNISVNIIPVPNTTINPAGPFCTSDENIVLTASESGGIWSGNGIVNENVGLFSPYLAGQGEHIITYTITGECSSSSQIIISVYDIFDASITSEKDFCYSENNIELTSASLGGIWQGNAVNPNTGILNIQQAGIGTHEIIYSKDGLCGDADTIYITIHPQANASIFAVDTLYDKDKPVYVETLEEGGVWSGVGITENGWFYPEISGPGEFEIIYTIQTICGDADTIIVYVLKSPIADLFIPNAITPDGDGHNDKWEILGIEAFDIVSINIFTRWGDEVFVFYGSGTQYMNPINQWEGKYKNKELPSGTYLYILKLNNKDTYKGTISLIR
ncbi:MAG: gliding motility-associated C-terminal domain-containing protein, partial [Bacteroidales bacterium]|nr:gliding motility-associated C-terminal domain-containing protein [Bacteroidales bacterium]